MPAEMSLKANLYYQLYEMISPTCNVFQLQILHLYDGVHRLLLPASTALLFLPSPPDT